MRLSSTLVCLSLAAGCASPYVAVPTAVHPTATVAGPSVGASVGAAYAKAEDQSALVAPHSEAWIRTQAGPGQIGLHLGPGIAGFGYRFDLMPMSNGVGLALDPMVAGGYFRLSEPVLDNPEVDEDSYYALTLAGSLRALILVPAGAGFFYVAPKIGYTTIKTSDDDNPDQPDEENDALTLGASVGIDLGGRPGLSLELSVHRIDAIDDAASDEPVWLIAPSLAFHMP